jgi:hypothetical protein
LLEEASLRLSAALSLVTLALSASLSVSRACAQALPTAAVPIRITAFGGFSGNFTGLALSKNADITAGADVEIRPFFTLYPALEVRGMYPVAGTIDRQRNILGGLRLAREAYGFHPYGDILFGRGQINYGNGGYPNPSGTLYYTETVGNVISFGGGVEHGFIGPFALKGDFQIQRYADTPVTPSNSIASKVFTAAVVYRFGFGHFPR